MATDQMVHCVYCGVQCEGTWADLYRTNLASQSQPFCAFTYVVLVPGLMPPPVNPEPPLPVGWPPA